MIQTLLIANRGEIAVRIAKTARRMGIRTVAVYSDADARAFHVSVCDEAVRIGPPPAADSYLAIDKIIAAAKSAGADAIHPGYGFLSENADFADACAAAGLVFVGPSADAIRIMGSKAASKELMAEAGVALAPGYQGADQSLKRISGEAARIGYPVMLKASAGGGGKGMRLVEADGDLEEALATVKREAKSSFGDDAVLLEKAIVNARHVEVQVFGDHEGSLVHLFERDCSIQRRHQKVIEEAPAPDLPDDVRSRLHELALAAARAVNYVGAGTVEFLYDADAGADGVYFLEMNTRLQVEHPVTEAVAGVDLVEWQLRVASGEPLPLAQDEIACAGHAIEARYYAEDPDRDFLPSTGAITRLQFPESDGVRVDAGVAPGGEASRHYDPMLAKIIAHGETRDQARRRLATAVSQTRLAGPNTNGAFLHRLLTHPAFAGAQLSTRFIDTYQDDLFQAPALEPAVLIAASIALNAQRDEGDGTPWSRLPGWRMTQPAVRMTWFAVDGAPIAIRESEDADGRHFDVQGQQYGVGDVAVSDAGVSLELDGVRLRIDVALSGKGLRIWRGAEAFDLTEFDPLAGPEASGAAAGSLHAPMPGVVTALKCAPGDAVNAGDTLLVMEAMKMEHAVCAPEDGVVGAYLHAVGDQVLEGDLLVAFEASAAGGAG